LKVFARCFGEHNLFKWEEALKTDNAMSFKWGGHYFAIQSCLRKLWKGDLMISGSVLGAAGVMTPALPSPSSIIVP